MQARNGDKVVVTHIPSGISASCLLNLYRYQHQCHANAMSLLKSRLMASQQIDVSLDDVNWKYTSCDHNPETPNLLK
jgi:protein subunit release factor A